MKFLNTTIIFPILIKIIDIINLYNLILISVDFMLICKLLYKFLLKQRSATTLAGGFFLEFLKFKPCI